MKENKNIQQIINDLNGLGKSRIGSLAETCGEAIKALSNPAALKVYLQIPGLKPESYDDGKRRYREYLSGFLKKLGFESKSDGIKGAGFITVFTETDEIVCVGVIRHLGNALGYAAAVATLPESGPVTLPDGMSLVISQIEARINALLTPGSPSSIEIFARRLLDTLSAIGVCAICVKPETPAHIVVSIAGTDKETSLCEAEEFPYEEPHQVETGTVINKNEISLLWSGVAGIAAAIWIRDSQNRLIAFGFSDKKLLNKSAREKIDRQLELLADDDIEYIVKSFEKLKADFKKMVNSERAAAVTETAVTVNHVINNPLTAILGNTQLLLMNKDKLSKETVSKLETIEKSAIQIREVTDKLMTIIEPVRKHYASGLEMIDIEKSKKKSDEEK
ncbi:MAG: hypothetical protein JSU85_11815 [Candidatus Zixiibacteriota bacterium]|nr:MAG: hypothetical protein JSU85_11815 [candidate division Zixibacteria bacterium]